MDFECDKEKETEVEKEKSKNPEKGNEPKQPTSGSSAQGTSH